MRRIVVIAALAAMVSEPAAAQNALIPADSVFNALQPILQAVGIAAATVLTALATQAVMWMRKKLNLSDDEATALGLQMDAAHRDALQTALSNAAGLALNKLGNDVKGKTIDVRNQAVQDAVSSVLKAAPDAIAYFGLNKVPNEIAEKIVAKIPQIANTTPATTATQK